MINAADTAVHVMITGRVQGVGYRAWLKRAAERFAISGWCRNLDGGAVEAVLSGRPEKVELLLETCEAGPPGCRVAAVQIVSSAEPVSGGFSIIEAA